VREQEKKMIDNPRLVIDVSYWDDRLDVPLLKKAGVAAVIVKCGSGMRRDSKFVSHAQAVVDGGLLLMAYYWDDIISDPTAQARWVVEDINATGLPVKFIWADQEQWWTNWNAWLAARRNEIPYTAVPRASPSNISLHNRIFAEALNALYPQSGVYSNYGFVTTWAPSIKEWIGNFTVWVAHYGKQPKIPIDITWEQLQKEWIPNYKFLTPPGAKEERIVGHQFTGDAFRLPGVYNSLGHNVLLDVSIFSEEFLKVISGGQTPPKPPTDPDPPVPPAGAREYFVNVAALNVRKGPGTQFNVVGLLNKNTTVRVVEIQGNWAHLDNDAWVDAWVYAPYLTAVAPTPPVPPVTPVSPVPPVHGREYYVNVPAVNVRKGPGTQFNVVGLMKQNTKVRVVEIQGQWAHLDNDAWVYAPYLSPVV
jgi:GH25 family lysozyme M1 (1,4-beta-N-acetylmuramidase)